LASFVQEARFFSARSLSVPVNVTVRPTGAAFVAVAMQAYVSLPFEPICLVTMGAAAWTGGTTAMAAAAAAGIDQAAV
jgi:hypothetical protein